MSEFRANINLLDAQITRLMERAESIKQRAIEEDKGSSDVLLSALEELTTALEELHVTEEELLVQHEELIQTRAALEYQRQQYMDLFQNAPDAYLVTSLGGVIGQANHAAAQLLNVDLKYLLGKPLSLYFAEDDRWNFSTRLTALVQGGDELMEWEARLQPREGAPMDAALRVNIIRDQDGRLAALRWLVRDITEQKRREAEIRHLNDDLEGRVRERTHLLETETRLKDEALARERAARLEAEALRETCTALSSSLDLNVVLEQVLVNIGRVVPHDAADVLLVEGKDAVPALCKGYEHCADLAYTTALRFSMATTFPLAEMYETARPVLLNDLETLPVWIQALEPLTPVRAYVGVPIVIQGEITGFLSLVSAHKNAFTETQLELLSVISTQVGIAIQNARLHAQARALAAMEERQRLARELHDAVSQALFSSSIVAESLMRFSKSQPEKVEEYLGYLLRLNRGASAEMRALLLELRPAHLTDIGLARQLSGLVDALHGRKEIAITLRTDEDTPLPPDVQIAFYRVAQESFNNIIKHSEATQVEVELVNSTSRVVLAIRDNGRGFDASQSKPGMGLHTMRERARGIDATLRVESSPQGGTHIALTWLREQSQVNTASR